MVPITVASLVTGMHAQIADYGDCMNMGHNYNHKRAMARLSNFIINFPNRL